MKYKVIQGNPPIIWNDAHTSGVNLLVNLGSITQWRIDLVDEKGESIEEEDREGIIARIKQNREKMRSLHPDEIAEIETGGAFYDLKYAGVDFTAGQQKLDQPLPVEVMDMLQTLDSHEKALDSHESQRQDYLYSLIQYAAQKVTDNSSGNLEWLNKQKVDQLQKRESLDGQRKEIQKTRDDLEIKKLNLLVALGKIKIEDLNLNIPSSEESTVVSYSNQIALYVGEIERIKLENKVLKAKVESKKSDDEDIEVHRKTRKKEVDKKIKHVNDLAKHHQALLKRLEEIDEEMRIEEEKKLALDEAHKQISEQVVFLSTPQVYVIKSIAKRIAERVEVRRERKAAKKLDDEDASKDFDWYPEEGLCENLQELLQKYQEIGGHTKNRTESAARVLARINELNKLEMDPLIRDRALLTLIRKEQKTISSYGFFGKPSKLHAIYRKAESSFKSLADKRAAEVDQLISDNDAIQESNDMDLAKVNELKKEIEAMEAEIKALERQGHKKFNVGDVRVEQDKKILEKKKAEYNGYLAVNGQLLSSYSKRSKDGALRKSIENMESSASTASDLEVEQSEKIPQVKAQLVDANRTLSSLRAQNVEAEQQIRILYLQARQQVREHDLPVVLTSSSNKGALSLVSLVKGCVDYLKTLVGVEPGKVEGVVDVPQVRLPVDEAGPKRG